MQEAMIEDLRADKRAWQEVAYKGGGRPGNAVTKG